MKLAMFISAAALALSTSMWASEAQAVEPAGHSFCKGGMGEPKDFARRIGKAVTAKPDGSAIVEGCQATAYELLLGFQQQDPKANLTSVSQLEAYANKLVEMPTEVGVEYGSACRYDLPNGGLVVKMACVWREVKPGEKVYGNPDTGARVIFSFCGNPGGVKLDPVIVTSNPCVKVVFPSHNGKGTPIRFAHSAARDLPGRCTKLEVVGEPKPFHDLPEECPDSYERVSGVRKYKVVCSWDKVEQQASELLGHEAHVGNVSGSFYARTEGTNVLWLPPEALNGMTTICWDLGEGEFIALSVMRPQFANGLVATITNADIEEARKVSQQ
ncbi:MAG: hypothetical protein AB199_03955 [Parcubacteria bacterium C7867-004]|nr:MAG: hypothetical protein AB199_03955 [Parcubacteria bacterium C7867-004]